MRSTWRSASRRLGEMEVRVGQARDRHLVGLEGEPPRERVGARLEGDLGAGEGDPPVADADRLDPAEAARPAERGDAAGDQGVERHALSRGRRGRPDRASVVARLPVRSGRRPVPVAWPRPSAAAPADAT